MNLSEWNPVDRAALRSFYEAGHQWSWEDWERGLTPAARTARDWIENSSRPRVHPLLLPRVQGSGPTQRTNWYAIAFNEAQAEELREHLTAFIGSAGTDFSGRRAYLDPEDVAESALAAWAGGKWVYRFEVLPGKRDVVRNALKRLQQVWRLRPPLPATVFRTTEALLREFFSALVNQDGTGALNWLGELRAGGRLSAENLVFLEIERLAAFGRWHELAALPQMTLILLMRRPRHITALLIEALWRTEFAEFADRGYAAEAAAHFRSDFFPRYHNLLRARGNLSGTPVILTFLLASVTVDPPRREQIALLLGALPECPERSFAEAIASLAGPTDAKNQRNESPLELARAAFHSDDYDTAWLHLQKAPPTPESCSLLLECADELQSEVAAQTVRVCVEGLSEQDKNLVFTSHRRRRAWEGIQKLLAPAGNPPPADWETWLDRNDSDPEWPKLLVTARQATSLWSISTYLHAPERVRRLADRLLDGRSINAEENFHLAFPHVVGFFISDGLGSPVFLPVYRNLLLLLGLAGGLSTEDWNTAQTLLFAILESGADGPVYEEAVAILTEVWRKFGAPVRFDWAMDTLDLLCAYPATAPAARDFFFDSVRDSFSKNYRRVSAEHWEIFGWLAGEIGRAEEYDALRPSSISTGESVETDLASILAGKLVAIYTLTESAGARAKAVLEKLFKNVDVRLSNDLGGSERLKSLAREADYFVVATRSAKHAATEFLKAQRPRGKSPLIYPSGKGSSSIVSSILLAVKAASGDN